MKEDGMNVCVWYCAMSNKKSAIRHNWKDDCDFGDWQTKRGQKRKEAARKTQNVHAAVITVLFVMRVPAF